MSTNENVIGWDDVEACVAAVAEHVCEACGVDGFDRVIGIARGGMIPAVLLASKLGVKRVESVQVRYYDGDTRLEEPTLIGEPPTPYGPSGDPRRTLLVDELVDSGDTMAYLGGLFPEAPMAALIARQRAAPPEPRGGLLPWICDPEGASTRPVWVARALPTERWILFPWSPPEDVAAGTGTS